MKTRFISLMSLVLLLTACGASTADIQGVQEVEATSSAEAQGKSADNHHADEENVEPHGHEEDAAPMPPSRSAEDHHEDEENVEPHGH